MQFQSKVRFSQWWDNLDTVSANLMIALIWAASKIWLVSIKLVILVIWTVTEVLERNQRVLHPFIWVIVFFLFELERNYFFAVILRKLRNDFFTFFYTSPIISFDAFCLLIDTLKQIRIMGFIMVSGETSHIIINNTSVLWYYDNWCFVPFFNNFLM